MEHTPERWTILGHLLKFSNIGPDPSEQDARKRIEQSPRGVEGRRIEEHRYRITEPLVKTVLEGKKTYVEIKNALHEHLIRKGVPDDPWIHLDLLAEALGSRRANMLAAMEKEGRFWSGHTFRFTSFVHVFTSRLWPEDNPPHIYPEPRILWADRMNERRVSAHRDRAATEAAKLRVDLLDLPLSESDDVETVTRNAEDYEGRGSGDPQVWINYDLERWPVERLRNRRDAEALESFVMACDGAIRMYEQLVDVDPAAKVVSLTDLQLLNQYGHWDSTGKRWNWMATDGPLAFVILKMAFFQQAQTRLAASAALYFSKMNRGTKTWEPLKASTIRSRLSQVRNDELPVGDEQELQRLVFLLDDEFVRVHGTVQP